MDAQTFSNVLQLAQLLAVPGVLLLWRISTQLAAFQAVQLEHARRLKILERNPE